MLGYNYALKKMPCNRFDSFTVNVQNGDCGSEMLELIKHTLHCHVINEMMFSRPLLCVKVLNSVVRHGLWDKTIFTSTNTRRSSRQL